MAGGRVRAPRQLSLPITLAAAIAISVMSVVAATGTAAAETKASDQVNVRTMPLAEVRPGMVGVGRTVFEGNRVEEFGVEILSVMTNFLGPDRHLILARLKGEKVEFTGVASGMSGSPVYVDGRLVGAVSYRILSTFMKEPIAGITPIDYMLEMAPQRDRPSPGRLARASEPPPHGVNARTETYVPIETPFVVSGVPPAVLAEYQEDFAHAGLDPIQAGAGGGSLAEPRNMAPLVPGDPVAMQLVRGDIGVAATGTVTHVDGDRVWAFGHYGLTMGAIEIPMARAEIYLTLSSVQASTKLSRINETIGTFTQSRLQGIAGVMGPAPDMIPVSVTWDASGASTTRNYEVARHREFTPLLVGFTTLSSLARTPGFAGEMTMSLQGRIHLEGHPDVVINDLFTGFTPEQSAAVEVARQMQSLFGAVFQNRFEDPRVTSVEITVRSVEQSSLGFVEGVFPTRTAVRPGESVEFRAVIRTYRGEAYTRTFTYRVPEGTPRGPLSVYVGGSDELDQLERNVFARQVAQADDLDQLIALINQLRNSETLYMKVSRRHAGAVVQNEVLPSLPPSVIATLGANRGTGDVTPVPETTLLEDRIPLEHPLFGGTMLRLEVK